MNTLTVARYNEDLTWIERFPDWYVHVVHKGHHLPNVGREPTSFLWSIVDLYDAVVPEHAYGFVQGDPFPHAANLAGLLHARIEFPPQTFVPLSHAPNYYSDANGMPHHGGLDVGRWYERVIGAPMPELVTFWPGGQFMIPGRLILARSEQWWADLLADLLADAATSPWAIERLWPALFAAIESTTDGR